MGRGRSVRRRLIAVCIGGVGLAALGAAPSASAQFLAVKLTASTTSVPSGGTVSYTVSVVRQGFDAMAHHEYDISSVTDSVFGDAKNFCGPLPRKPPFTCTSYPEVLNAPPGGTSVTNSVTVRGTDTVTPDFQPTGPPSPISVTSNSVSVAVTAPPAPKGCKKGQKLKKGKCVKKKRKKKNKK